MESVQKLTKFHYQIHWRNGLEWSEGNREFIVAPSDTLVHDIPKMVSSGDRVVDGRKFNVVMHSDYVGKRSRLIPVTKLIGEIETTEEDYCILVDTLPPRTRWQKAQEILRCLAKRLSGFYTFKYDQEKGPQFEDVLRAKKGGVIGKDWDHIRYAEDGFDQRYISEDPYPVKKGDPLTDAPLPDIFGEASWKFVERIHDLVNGPNPDDSRISLEMLDRVDNHGQVPL